MHVSGPHRPFHAGILSGSDAYAGCLCQASVASHYTPVHCFESDSSHCYAFIQKPGDHCPYDTVQHPGNIRAGLHPDRQGAGIQQTKGHIRMCVKECHECHCDGRRTTVWPFNWWCSYYREGIWMAGSGGFNRDINKGKGFSGGTISHTGNCRIVCGC